MCCIHPGGTTTFVVSSAWWWGAGLTQEEMETGPVLAPLPGDALSCLISTGTG